ncbi:MAG: methylmalonyl-CoA epimerase [candidate division WOR-3 bacterium]
MLKNLSHIGIAVQSIANAKKFFGEILKLGEPKIIDVPDQQVKVAIFPFAGFQIELLEPLSSDSTIAKFLEKRGEGIHHLCFNVENIENALTELKKAGVTLIDEKPRIGATGNKIAFVSPKSTYGVLIELREPKIK